MTPIVWKPGSRTFAVVACGLCGAYACTHVAMTIVAPYDSQRDATTLVSATTSADTGYSLHIFDTITEAEYRVDMPWLKGFMPTKPSA